jgi:hypothetical protein
MSEAGSPGRVEAVVDTAKATLATAEGAITKPDGRDNGSTSDNSPRGHTELNFADPGYQPDGKQRYPIDTDRRLRAAWSYINKPRNARRYTAEQLKRITAKIIAAWKEKIDSKGPPSGQGDEKASCTAFSDVGRVVQIITELDWLQDLLEIRAMMEADVAPQSVRLQAIITDLRSFLNDLVVEESDEILDNLQIEAGADSSDIGEFLAMAAEARGAARITALLKTGNPKMQMFAASLLAKAKHSQGDQALVDMAHYACEKCLQIGGLSVEKEQHMGEAHERLRQAGAVTLGGSTADTRGSFADVASPTRRPPSDFRHGDNATIDTSGMSDSVAAGPDKRDRDVQKLMDLAHDCVCKLTGGMACSDRPQSSNLGLTSEECADTDAAATTGTRHSPEMMGHLCAAHDQLVAAGAECEAADSGKEEIEGTEFEAVKALQTREFTKMLAGERAEKAALVKALSDMLPLLDRLSKRVDDIARTPLPPLTIARGSIALSKQDDGGSVGGHSDSALSPEAIASALAKMSKEEQTLTLIKASYANPITVHGPATGER